MRTKALDAIVKFMIWLLWASTLAACSAQVIDSPAEQPQTEALAQKRCAVVIADTASNTMIIELSEPGAKLAGCHSLSHGIGNLWLCPDQWCSDEPAFLGYCPVCESP